MSKKYIKLDTIKLALDSSCLLLEIEGDKLTESNIKSINHTINDANRRLRELIEDTKKYDYDYK